VLTNEFYPSSLAFSPDSKTLAVGCFRTLPPDGLKTLAFWDLTSKRKLERLAAAATNAGVVAFSHDGRLLAIGYFDGWVRLWDYRTGKKLSELRESRSPIWAVAFSPHSTMVASSADNKVILYDVVTQRVSALQGQVGPVLSIAFAPDGRTLASVGDDDGTVRLWNLATHQTSLTLRGQIGPVYSVAFTSDGNLLSSGGSDGDVRLWAAASWQEVDWRKRQ
jgi:WD40 repeat protein